MPTLLAFILNNFFQFQLIFNRPKMQSPGIRPKRPDTESDSSDSVSGHFGRILGQFSSDSVSGQSKFGRIPGQLKVARYRVCPGIWRPDTGV